MDYQQSCCNFIESTMEELPQELPADIRKMICTLSLPLPPTWVDYPYLNYANNDPNFPWQDGHWMRATMIQDGFRPDLVTVEQEVMTLRLQSELLRVQLLHLNRQHQLLTTQLDEAETRKAEFLRIESR